MVFRGEGGGRGARGDCLCPCPLLVYTTTTTTYHYKKSRIFLGLGWLCSQPRLVSCIHSQCLAPIPCDGCTSTLVRAALSFALLSQQRRQERRQDTSRRYFVTVLFSCLGVCVRACVRVCICVHECWCFLRARAFLFRDVSFVVCFPRFVHVVSVTTRLTFAFGGVASPAFSPRRWKTM